MAAKARIGLACLLLSATALPLAAQFRGEPMATLPGHVPGLLRSATLRPRDPQAANEQFTFTVLLNLADPAGFEAFSQSLNDPNSPNFHHPISAGEITARFGPAQETYDTVRSFLERSGFTLVEGSDNRRTLTVRGTRAQAEAAFQVSIDDYQLGTRTFRAASQDPAVPVSLAPFIAGVSGLSSVGQMRPHSTPNPQVPSSTATAYNGTVTPAGSTNSGGLPPGLNGAGQTVGVLEIDNYANSDLSNTIAFSGLPAGVIHQVSRFPINGGTSVSGCGPTTAGCGTTEALLDIIAVLGSAPGANVIVFDAPSSTDIYDMVNGAIGQVNAVTGGIGGIISASLGLCETEISSSDATGIDGLLKTGAASGLTLFAATGDSGSTCTDGSGNTFPNTINYPAGVPHAVAVGGTNLSVDASNNYSSENWWKGGGYGISTIFPTEPGYQSKLYPSAGGRSVPDVSAESEPGIVVCQATTKNPSGCYPIAGTSLATPLWAGYWALVNQAWNDAAGTPSGPSGADGYLYYYPKAFHSAASMGSDFAHVGLGSPDVTTLVAMASPGYSQVNNVSPDSGKASGGTSVTIKGLGFIGVTKVTFGGADATKVTIHSDSKLTAESPAASGAQVEVKVETPAGRTIATSGDTFSYVPEVDKVKPAAGPFYGGTSVTVTGLALSDKYTFKFGGTAATKVSCSSDTKCTMVTPDHAAGKVAVEVEAPAGSSSTPDLYDYQGLSIKSFTPNVGPTTGGVQVTINGVSLKNGMTVSFGGANATASSCYDGFSCYVTSPPHAVGSVPLTATLDGVTSAATSDQFTFKVFPTITGIFPSTVPVNTGTVAANTTLTITGTGFSTTGTTFNIYGTALTSVTCSSATKCTAVISVPPGVTLLATDPVTVTVSSLTSLDSVNLTYPSPPPPPPPGGCGTKCR
ncbi:MAG TPA: IPT/TIG domain-containing protein [Bryobacteraceae bacterium]|nr:IPT/TIG domain-containing protein [Bryobacteraceae bacterium]